MKEIECIRWYDIFNFVFIEGVDEFIDVVCFVGDIVEERFFIFVVLVYVSFGEEEMDYFFSSDESSEERLIILFLVFEGDNKFEVYYGGDKR